MTIAERVNGLTIWRDGNGAPGAEERIRKVEQIADDVRTGKACTAAKLLEAISGDVKKLNKWFFLMTVFMAALVGDRILSFLSLIK